jgi:hypothetical protein
MSTAAASHSNQQRFLDQTTTAAATARSQSPVLPLAPNGQQLRLLASASVETLQFLLLLSLT